MHYNYNSVQHDSLPLWLIQQHLGIGTAMQSKTVHVNISVLYLLSMGLVIGTWDRWMVGL